LADIPKQDLWKEEFELGDLVKDWKSLMEKQELGWDVPVELANPVPSVKWRKDYVLMRTLLQTVATHANPVPSRNPKRLPMKVVFEEEKSELVIRMAVQADAQSEKKTMENLKVAQTLAPILGTELVEEAGILKLTLKKGD